MCASERARARVVRACVCAIRFISAGQSTTVDNSNSIVSGFVCQRSFFRISLNNTNNTFLYALSFDVAASALVLAQETARPCVDGFIQAFGVGKLMKTPACQPPPTNIHICLPLYNAHIVGLAFLVFSWLYVM